MLFRSRFDTGLAVWLAGIRERYAPATKIAQLFYNRRVVQRRSRSEKSEYEYNLDLVRAFLKHLDINPSAAPMAPYLHFDDAEVRGLREAFCRRHAIPIDTKLVFMHAGHRGSSAHLSLGQYALLTKHLTSAQEHHVVLTVGPGEEQLISRLSSLMTAVPHSIHASQDGLVSFAKHLQFSDVFISGGTGPLHLAGALNCRTAAFYPRRRSTSSLRWQTVNAADRRLAFTPTEDAGDDAMSSDRKSVV